MKSLEDKRAYDREYKRRRRAGLSTRTTPAPNSVASMRPSATLEADRERRAMALAQASITALAFGDPPPGFSALERRDIGAPLMGGPRRLGLDQPLVFEPYKRT